MSPIHFFKILWMTLQMILVLIGPHSESAAHFHSYVSAFQYIPQYHPSRNPACTSQWLGREFHEGRFEHDDRLSFEEQERPWIQIKAVLVRCPRTRKKVGKALHRQRQNCRRKAIISMKINNVGKTNTREEFVLVDHVLDPTSMHKIRLHNPYVIKIRQEPLLHLYALRFQGVVNAEAKEEVINNQRVNFTGCNDGLDNPTCGQMLINEESVPYSQGFCCSCDLRAVPERSGSFRSAAKSNYQQRQWTNSARNRSESTTNLFDNSAAQRQVETRREEHTAVATRRVTSHDASPVNGPFGEPTTSPIRQRQGETTPRGNNNSLRPPPSQAYLSMEKARRAETPSPVLKSALFEPVHTKGKIEAYIDAVYEQAMRARTAAKQEDLSHGRDRAGNFGVSTDGSSDSDRRIGDGSSSAIRRFSARGSVRPYDPANRIAKALASALNFSGTIGKDEDRKFHGPERSMNFSQSENCEGKIAATRSVGATRAENTFDYASTCPTILHSPRAAASRIPTEDRFSRRTEKNALRDADNASPDNGSFGTTVRFFTAPGRISSGCDSNESINYDVTPAATMRSSDFEEDVFALLSKVVISQARRPSEERRCGFGRATSISDDDVSAMRNASIERKYPSDSASETRENAGNANVSTRRLSPAVAFTRLRDLSASDGISRPAELSAITTARPAVKSPARIPESRARGMLSADETQLRRPGENSAGLGSRESRNGDPGGIHNSLKQVPKDVNLKNLKSKGFWKPRRKSRKGAEVRGGRRRRELRRKRASPYFKRGRFGSGSWKRGGYLRDRFRRHLRTGKEDCDSTSVRDAQLKSQNNESPRGKMQAFVDYRVQPEPAPAKRKMSQADEAGGNSKKQVILAPSHSSHGEIQTGDIDNAFFRKENNVDKRIEEDKLVRISNVLKEDLVEGDGILESPEISRVATSGEVSKRTQDERTNGLFSQTDDRMNSITTPAKVTQEHLAELIGTRPPSNESLLATVNLAIMIDQITTTSIARKNDSAVERKKAFLRPGEELSTAVTDFAPSLLRKSEFNPDEPMDQIYAANITNDDSAIRRPIDSFTPEIISSEAPRFGGKVDDYPEVADSSEGISPGSARTEFKETTTFRRAAPRGRVKYERDDGAGTKFLELSNESLRIITGHSTEPLRQGFSSYGGGREIAEPEEISPSDRKRDGVIRRESSFLADSKGISKKNREESSEWSQRSQQKDEIAELVDQVVRQYTPIMPDMPTFDKITEGGSLPAEETTGSQLTTTLGTTTVITDQTFRPSIRPLGYVTTPFVEEIHDEVSLDDTFADELEAMTSRRGSTAAAAKESLQVGRSSAKFATEEQKQKVSNRTTKSERREKSTDRITAKMTNAEKEAEDHPWYRTTEMQQIIVASGFKPEQKVEIAGKKQRCKSKQDYFQDASSEGRSSIRTISASRAAFARTRSTRSSFIRESNNGDSSVFHDYGREERNGGNRRSERTASNENVEFPDTAQPIELRSEIGKRLADGSDYLTNRKSLRRARESQDQTHRVALQDITWREDGASATNDIERRRSDSDARRKKRRTPWNSAHLPPRDVRDDDEDISRGNREAIVMSDISSPGPAKISTWQQDFSGSVHQRTETDRRAEKGERLTEPDHRVVVVVRKIAVKLPRSARSTTASEDDLSVAAEPRRATSGILPGRARTRTRRGENRETHRSVIARARPMMASDKDDAPSRADLQIAAGSVDRKMGSRSSFVAIKENPANVPAEKEHLRCSRRDVYDTVHEILNNIEKNETSSAKDEMDRSIARSEDRADRSPPDAGSDLAAWSRSGRRLLSSGKSSYIRNVDDEYYENDKSEIDGENDSESDDEAIARSDDLSVFQNRPRSREDGDGRKLVPDRLVGENIDAIDMMSEEKTGRDTAMIADNTQLVSEEAISRNNEKKIRDNERDIRDSQELSRDVDAVGEPLDPVKSNDEMLQAPFEKKEESIENTADNNNNPIERKNFDDSDNFEHLRIYEEVDEEPLSLDEKTYDDDPQDESLDVSQPAASSAFTTEKTINSSAATARAIIEKALRDADPSRDWPTSRNEGSVRISLSGRIRVNDGFNRTPILISFDAFPENSSIALFNWTVPISSSNSTVTVVVDPSLRADSALNSASTAETDERMYDSPAIASDEDEEELGKTNTSVVATRSREKFFDLAQSGEGKSASEFSRIEKRKLDKDSANSRTVKQVFLTDYSMEPSDRMGKTASAGRTIFQGSQGTIGKSDPRSSVYFPDILGSVLVNNGSTSENQNATEGSRCRITLSNETNRFDSTIRRKNMTLHVVPLIRVGIEKTRVDDGNATQRTCCPKEDSRDTTSGGCYGMPTTVRKLELSKSTWTQSSVNYRDGDRTGSTIRTEVRKTSPQDTNETAKGWNASARTSPSAKLHGISEDATGSLNIWNKTLLPGTNATCKCNGKSMDAVRVRNMMAIVRFMMKLLRIVARDEELACPGQAQIGQTMIRVQNVVVNDASRRNVSDHWDSDKTTPLITSRDLMTVEWRSTIAGGKRQESLPLRNGVFESFTKAPTVNSLSTSSDEAFKDEEPFIPLFETSTGAQRVHVSSGTIPSPTPESFLFYEAGRKSLHEDASRKNTSIGSTNVRKNSKEDSSGKESRLEDSQAGRSSSQPLSDQDRNTVDRRNFGKQEITFVTSLEKHNGGAGSGSSEEQYLARNKNVGSRWWKSSGIAANEPTLSRDIDASRDTLLGKGQDKSVKSRRRMAVSDRAVAGIKSLNGFAREGFPADWIRERRTATSRPLIDKKLQKSRKTPEKVVFREEINRPPDPNLEDARNDPFKVESHAVDSDPAIRLSSGGSESLDLSERVDSSAQASATRYSRTSSADNLRDSSSYGPFDEEAARDDARSSNLATSYGAANKKRDVSRHRDFRRDNRVFRKRQKAAAPAKAGKQNRLNKKKKKKKKQKGKKKGSQGPRDTSGIRNQQRFKRHLLTMSLEPRTTYDADDVATGLSRSYVAARRNAEDFAKSARLREAGTRAVDESEVDPGRAQIRGGQDCMDRRHPANIDAAKYLESAHCLRFSDLWYSVYRLEDPVVEHTVYFQIYEKRVSANGSIYWQDLTGDATIRLGTFNRRHRSKEDTIALVYREVKRSRRQALPNLDIARDRLLVPSSLTSKGSEYPAEGDSDSEYLVVPASSISENGNECDKAGVGFAAFARQPNRCERVRGTCLKNQPLAYRRHDSEARAAGRPGCYFLSNFAPVPSEPIKYSANGSGSREFLALEYHSPHVSAIDIEIRTSYNAALAAGGPSGRISKMYADNAAFDHTVLTVVMSNKGPTSVAYRSRITECPVGLPESWMNATFPKKIIQAGRDQSVSLDLYGELPVDEFYCSVQLLNRHGEPVAARRIRIRKMDRCSCVLHCLCVCVGDARGTDCRPMSPELYHAAGFRGPVPTTSPGREIFSDTTVNVLLFVISLMSLLLFLGLLKWLIGLYRPAVGRWGLDTFLRTSEMSEYFERELKRRYVVTDESGAPVHPDTRKKTVRICSRKAEFFLNAMFFLIFPLAVCYHRVKRSFPPVRERRYSDGSKISLTSDSSGRPKMICVTTYGDNRDSRMEAEDTKYVLDELKKSEESLRDHTRNKRSRCTRECHSRH